MPLTYHYIIACSVMESLSILQDHKKTQQLSRHVSTFHTIQNCILINIHNTTVKCMTSTTDITQLSL